MANRCSQYSVKRKWKPNQRQRKEPTADVTTVTEVRRVRGEKELEQGKEKKKAEINKIYKTRARTLKNAQKAQNKAPCSFDVPVFPGGHSQ